jgi:hypothetical protein
MERKPFEQIESFIKRTDFMRKLRAALETIEQSNGYKVFNGLQEGGSCGVCMHFDGEIVTLHGLEPECKPDIQVSPKPGDETLFEPDKKEPGKKGKTK